MVDGGRGDVFWGAVDPGLFLYHYTTKEAGLGNILSVTYGLGHSRGRTIPVSGSSGSLASAVALILCRSLGSSSASSMRRTV